MKCVFPKSLKIAKLIQKRCFFLAPCVKGKCPNIMHSLGLFSGIGPFFSTFTHYLTSASSPFFYSMNEKIMGIRIGRGKPVQCSPHFLFLWSWVSSGSGAERIPGNQPPLVGQVSLWKEEKIKKPVCKPLNAKT